MWSGSCERESLGKKTKTQTKTQTKKVCVIKLCNSGVGAVRGSLLTKKKTKTKTGKDTDKDRDEKRYVW